MRILSKTAALDDELGRWGRARRALAVLRRIIVRLVARGPALASQPEAHAGSAGKPCL